MDDTWVNALRRDPSLQFAEQLRARLRAQEAPSGSHWSPLRRLVPLVIGAVAVAALFSLPSVRASAASFLALFRVVNFVAIPVDPNRLDALEARQLDLQRLIGDHVQVLQDPGPPLAVASIEQAATVAGFDVRVPRWLPDDTKIIEMSVRGEHELLVTADATRLQQVMEALGITDLRAPDGLDGQIVTVRVPPVVMVRYEHGGRRTRLFQAQSPDVTMPAGVDAASLGEIGLRILGLPREEARRFAQMIDWNTTLLVPVPPTARSFKQVDIAGNPGVAIEHRPPNHSPTNLVLWSSEGRVFALVSIQGMSQALAMANSVR
ncbi:MAG: hypothetical protein GEV06_06050 [Luteitalea sp.]|nr:hypothetical protein [Luteitalea sp.]